MHRYNLREVRKTHPELPDCCQRCQLCLQDGVEYRYGRGSGNHHHIAHIVDTPADMTGFRASGDTIASVQCHVPDDARTKTGKIPSSYIQYCSQFVKEDIEEINPHIILTEGLAARESIEYLGLNRQIDTAHTTNRNGTINNSAYKRADYYKEHGNFIQPEVIPFIGMQGILDAIQAVNANKNVISKPTIIGLDFEWQPSKEQVGMIPHTLGVSFNGIDGYICAYTWISSEVKQWLRKLVGNPLVTIVGHDVARAEIQRLFDMGLHPIDIKCKWEDSMITTWELVDRAGNVALKDLGYNNMPIINYWKDIDMESYEKYSEPLGVYCAHDAWLGLYYFNNLVERYAEHWGVIQPAHKLDMDMLLPTAWAMWKGIGINSSNILSARKLAEQAIEKYHTFFKTCGVNPVSHDQVIDYTNKLLGMKLKSTDAKYLRALTDIPPEQKEFIDNLLLFRQYNTVLTRYLTDDWLVSSKVHSYIQVAKANTGRPSYSSPNIANIPEDLRYIFESTHGDNGTLVTYDRQGSEYRVAAYLSQHTALCQSFIDGVDIHDYASELTGIDRRAAKTLNFQYLYWGRPQSVIDSLAAQGVDDAEGAFRRYDRAMNMIRTWQQKLIDHSLGIGYVPSPTGRRGYRLKPTSIVNFPFQSWSSDLNKQTLLFFFNRMIEEGLQSHIWCEFYDGTEIDVVNEELPMIRQIAGECFDYIPDILNRDLHIPFPLEEKINGRFWGVKPNAT